MKPIYLGKKNNSLRNLKLDKISRSDSRKSFKDSSYYGLDIWNAYEFSYLLNGKPKIIVLEISIPSDSEFTIESKSMKLYLNSYYKQNFISQSDILNQLTEKISKKCNSKIKIISKSSFKEFNKNEFTNKSSLFIYKGFRSVCPVTSQPDWGNIYVYSLTDPLYKKEISDFLFSFRNHEGFHEQCIEKIYLHIKNKYSLDHLEVCGRFLRRGGIDINPIRSSQKKLFFKNFREFNQ